MNMIEVVKVIDVVEEMCKLDQAAYPEENTDYDGVDWYLNRYDGREVVYVYRKDNIVIGYLTCAFIKPEFAAAIVNGVLDGDMVVSNNMFRGDGSIAYLNSIVVDPDYRGQGICRELLDRFMSDHATAPIYSLANEHTVKAFIANGFKAVTKAGHYTAMTINV